MTTPILLMDSLSGRTEMVIDDTLPPASNVMYTSANAPQRLACIGQCHMLKVQPLLKLVPIDDSDNLVVNDTFTCPKDGMWMLWVNWGHAGTANTPARYYDVYYKINANANVLLGGMYMSARCNHAVVVLKKGDKVSFPAMQYISSFVGSYCFEYIGVA